MKQLALSSEGPPQYQGAHYKRLYTAFSLFQSIYLPEDGEEDVPVGDELLDWLNTHFIDPSNEEADQLGSSERPWESEVFWSYVTRYCIRLADHCYVLTNSQCHYSRPRKIVDIFS